MESKKKKGSDELRDRTGKRHRRENGLEDMGRGKGKLGQSDRVVFMYIHY